MTIKRRIETGWEEEMAARVNGLHHVTSGVWGAQEDIDFFTQVVGQRMIKQTILFDGTVSFYHLYYANADAEVGSVSTTFPFSKMGIKGRAGSGQIGSTGYSVPVGSIAFWRDHLKKHKTAIVNEGERFGQKTLRFRHPAGLEFEMIEDGDDKTKAWTTKEIKADSAVRGFHSVAMAVRDIEEQERFLTEGLGLTKVGVEGKHHRYRVNEGGAQKTVELVHEPDMKQGSWQFAPGIVHHVAFAVPTEKEQLEVKAHLEGLGYTDVSEIKDRNYFHSIYCRSPGGILCEVATCDIGFAIDEPKEHLGEKLLLPPWFEPRRPEIEAQLEKIKVPQGSMAH